MVGPVHTDVHFLFLFSFVCFFNKKKLGSVSLVKGQENAKFLFKLA